MKTRINQILHALNADLFEREEVLQLALLTTLAGESIFLLGPPGVAKSLIARRIKEIFKDGNSFEYLMNRFSTPDEIFGPIAISKLKKDDKYERITENYLPTADIVFLDEIWKAGPSIQNSLLTVINEKIYRNGQQEVNIPLKGLISASNELPTKGEGLEALWDRFIIRYLVDNISDSQKFNQFLTTENIGFDVVLKDTIKITDSEFQQWQASINKVTLSEEALNVINVIRSYIVKHNNKESTQQLIYVSDRRWKKIVKILKTSAFLNDRNKVDLMDCFLIAHTIWDEVEQIAIVKEFVADAIKTHGYSLKYNLSLFTDEIDILKSDIKHELQYSEENLYYCIDLNEPSYILAEDVEHLRELASQNKYSTSTHLYDEDGNELSLVEAQYLQNQKSVRIRDHGHDEYSRYGWKDYKLSKSETITHVETKKPHRAVLKEWDKTVANIVEQIDNTVAGIETFKNTDLASLKDNLFVNKSLASLAEHNLNQTINNFLAEKIKVEKLKAGYDAL